MNNTILNKVREIFEQKFRSKPMLIRAPGRINLIGEHTDYNHGFVVPGAIDKATYFAVGRSGNKNGLLISIDMDESFSYSIDNLKKSGKEWPDYILGVISELKNLGADIPEGLNCVFSGDIPIGAGMSSSASVEAGIALTLNELFYLNFERRELAQIAQRAENDFVGVRSGIMDQFTSFFGEEGHVLCIDCRSLTYEKLPFDYPNLSIVLCDTGIKHSLASSEYNTRRKECEEGVIHLQKKYPEVTSLREATLQQLEEIKEEVSHSVYKRCHYVISEIERVIKAVDALKNKDIVSFGDFMDETHEGLCEMYEVSCLELDLLADYTFDMDFVVGARMMGGGFGGCTINLVNNDSLEEFSKVMTERYKQDTGKNLKIYINQITSGAEIIES